MVTHFWLGPSRLDACMLLTSQHPGAVLALQDHSSHSIALRAEVKLHEAIEDHGFAMCSSALLLAHMYIGQSTCVKQQKAALLMLVGCIPSISSTRLPHAAAQHVQGPSLELCSCARCQGTPSFLGHHRERRNEHSSLPL